MDFEAFVGCHVDVAIAVVTRDLSVELCSVSLPSHVDNLTTNTKPSSIPCCVVCSALRSNQSHGHPVNRQSTASQPSKASDTASQHSVNKSTHVLRIQNIIVTYLKLNLKERRTNCQRHTRAHTHTQSLSSQC